MTKNEKDNDFSFLFKSIKTTCVRVHLKEPTFEFLVADNAGAITNGTEKNFDIVGRVNCWAHVIRNIDIQLKSVEQQHRENLRKDITKIQIIFEKSSFDVAIQLFNYKWKSLKNSSINNFLQYFNRQWCTESNKGWFEGFAVGVPSTSNVLESFHQRNTLVHNWSVTRSPSLKMLDSASNVENEIDNVN